MNTTGNLIPITPSDECFQKVIKLDLQQFPKPWKKSDWSLNWDHHLLYGWQFSGNLLGFALFARVSGDDSAHLLKICLDAEYRGSAHASMFWKSCLLNLKNLGVGSIYLEVETENKVAIAFYNKSGFKVLMQVKAYYSDGGDAFLMSLTT